MVFSGFVTAWRLAIVPTRISPLSSQATTDGVSREPSSFTMTLGSLPSITATTLFVVPKSIPMILPMFVLRDSRSFRRFAAAQNLDSLPERPARPLDPAGTVGQLNHPPLWVNRETTL